MASLDPNSDTVIQISSSGKIAELHTTMTSMAEGVIFAGPRRAMRIANKPASESAPGTHRPPERPLFEPPRIRSKDEGKRPTSWLEFFFDLVFVVAVDQVARRL